jgi:hypothetical protein
MLSAVRRVVVVTLICLVVIAGSTLAWAKAKNTTAGAQAATLRDFAFINKRQWGLYYGYLHPAQRSLVTKDQFMACIDKAIPEGLSIKVVKFTDHYPETATIPGTNVQAQTTALTLMYRVTEGREKQTATDTEHKIWVNNKWTWAMDATELATCTTA